MIREYMMLLPLPVIVAEGKTNRILYANKAAANSGFDVSQIFNATAAGSECADDTSERNVHVAKGSRTLRAVLRETWIRFEGKAARLIVLTSLHDEADMLSEWDICALFANADKKGGAGEFLRMTGKNAGAYCAALYEAAREQRYVLREEWRTRRSVSIPVLKPDFTLHIEAESQQIKRIKGAADIAVFPYTKSFGTKGVAVYFFDIAPGAAKKERLRRFVSLYGAFTPDSPDSSRLVLHHGVGALEQGIAIWKEASRVLLYCNAAYRRMFGRSNTRMISDTLGRDIRGRVTRETISDGRGRYFDVTHTACGNRSQGVISTIIIDNTAYVKAQRRLDIMARTDALTGLFNRRAGLEFLERMYAQCRQQKRPLTVCFADIDGLKHINDNWGHGAGDAMIQAVAGVIRKYVGDLGAVCRLGGDEFVLILPGQTTPQATLLASQIRREAERCFVGDTDGIALSFGFKQAEFIAGETANTLVSVADMEMYREKNSKTR